LISGIVGCVSVTSAHIICPKVVSVITEVKSVGAGGGNVNITSTYPAYDVEVCSAAICALVESIPVIAI
jgi:hypothetical protein